MTRNRRVVTNRHQPPQAKPHQKLERLRPVSFLVPDLETEINKLDGVTSSRVVSTGVEIEEIHVISPPDRVPKKVVRDIESLLLVHFGIRIDHRKISVIHWGEPSNRAAGFPRPRIVKVERRMTEAGKEVYVEIQLKAQITFGTALAEPDESDLRVSGRALIRALENLTDRRGVLFLEDISAVRIDDQEIVLSQVRWRTAGQEELLMGATAARGVPLEDAARATFDAVNRRLARVG